MSGKRDGRQCVYFLGSGQADGCNELRHLVGGKGASLAEMTKAGLNVPPGFTISAECCDLYFRNEKNWPAGLDEEVRANLSRLEQLTGRAFGERANPLLVAVRSGAAQSMPGMMDTILNVGLNSRDPSEAYECLRSAFREHTGHEAPAEPWEQLRQAINAVFESWNSERAAAYRQRHQIDGLLGTAVTIQAMCAAEVSGVMFTTNPVSPGSDQIVIESASGLGEALVLGKITPDRFVLNKENLEVSERSKGTDCQGLSLSDPQLQGLARLGLRVEEYFKHPCDIEWALADGKFYLLQSRPIKLAGWAESSRPTGVLVGLDDSAHPTDSDRKSVRREEIAALAAKAEPGGTVWSRFNLAEILPTPTPMTWAIIRRFMSGRGGFGMMYRDLGFDPDPALDEEGIYDLVCGRPYCNLSREPRMQYRRLPFEHNFAALKVNPNKALYPQAVLNPARAGWRFWLFFPAVVFKLVRSGMTLRRLSRTFAQPFRDDIIPTFMTEANREAGQDISDLEPAKLLERLNYWIQRTLYDFARDSLKPTALAAVALGNLE